MTPQGRRRKGMTGETEVVDFLCKLGIPSQRVVASGSFIGADSDIKVGVVLKKDGTMPDRDESSCAFRAEVKNRKDNPERLWTFLNQSIKNKVLFLRRPRVPQGKANDANESWVAVMKLEDWSKIVKYAIEHGFEY